jgi:hypothetical protein
LGKQLTMLFRTYLLVALAAAALSACTPTSQDGLSGAVVSSSAIRTPYSMTISTEQARVGETSQRFEVRHGDCYELDCTDDRRRVEYQQPNEASNSYIGRTVWYGWSVYLPADFRDLSPTNTTIGQVQMHGWRAPQWNFNARDGALLFGINDERRECRATSLASMRGRWTDIVVMTHYSTERTGAETIGVWINGRKACTSSQPVVTDEMLSLSPTDALRFKYGIYNSYISRWLQRNATRRVNATAFADLHKDSGRVIRSAAARPYEYDWGVELPTQVVYYDEVRIGFTREEVDIRMRLQ